MGEHALVSRLDIVVGFARRGAIGGHAFDVFLFGQHPVVAHDVPGHRARVPQVHREALAGLRDADRLQVVGHLVGAVNVHRAGLVGPRDAGQGQGEKG
ncbi:hypothetical protein D3C79_996340 [compost metagenome]